MTTPSNRADFAPEQASTGSYAWRAFALTTLALLGLTGLTEALRIKGHDIHGAADAASALALAASVNPHVALLDIGLPAIDGYELARRLRAIPGLEQIKLAAVTGYGQPTDRERARAAGFDEHLVKPISLEDIEQVVDRLLSK